MSARHSIQTLLTAVSVTLPAVGAGQGFTQGSSLAPVPLDLGQYDEVTGGTIVYDPSSNTSRPVAPITPIIVAPAPVAPARLASDIDSSPGIDPDAAAEDGPLATTGDSSAGNANAQSPSASRNEPVAGVEPVPSPIISAPENVVTIVAPRNGAVLSDADRFAQLRIRTTLSKQIAPEMLQAEVLIDGKVVASGPLDGVSFAMPEHGAHVLTTRVTGAGRVLATSESQSLHVKKMIGR